MPYGTPPATFGNIVK